MKKCVYGFKSRSMAAVYAAGLVEESGRVSEVKVGRVVLPEGDKPWAVTYIVTSESDVDSPEVRVDVRDVLEKHGLPRMDN